MLPVLVMSCLRAGLARARYTFPDFRPPKAFWEDLLSRPLLFLCPCGTRIHTNENRRKCPAASDSGITRRPKIPIIFYCSGTIRAGRSCRSISRGRTSVFGPGSGGTPSRRTIAAGVIRFSERHIQSRIPDAAGRHCAGSGPWNLVAGAVSALNSS